MNDAHDGFLLGIVSAEDDEYRWAGVEDPKVIVTTSHDPSSKLKQFSKVDVHRVRDPC